MQNDKFKRAVSSLPEVANPVRLCFVSYRPLSKLAKTLLHEYSGRAEIEVFDETFGSALEFAIHRERLGLVDAFVSAGGNAATLRGAVKSPVASIAIGGFDLLLALIKAGRISRRVGVVTYERTVPELDAVKAILNIEIEQRTYRNYEEAARATHNVPHLLDGLMRDTSRPFARLDQGFR